MKASRVFDFFYFGLGLSLAMYAIILKVTGWTDAEETSLVVIALLGLVAMFQSLWIKENRKNRHLRKQLEAGCQSRIQEDSK